MAVCREYRDTRTTGAGEVDRYWTTDIPLDTCGDTSTDVVIMPVSEYVALSNVSNAELSSMFEYYFAFDTELFLYLQAMFLIAFIGAFALGKTINILNISNR